MQDINLAQNKHKKILCCKLGQFLKLVYLNETIFIKFMYLSGDFHDFSGISDLDSIEYY